MSGNIKLHAIVSGDDKNMANGIMKEAVYEYSSNERKFTRDIEQPKYVSEESQERDQADGTYEHTIVWQTARDYDDFER